MASPKNKKKSSNKRSRRWGDAAAAPPTSTKEKSDSNKSTTNDDATTSPPPAKQPRRSRFSSKPPAPDATSTAGAPHNLIPSGSAAAGGSKLAPKSKAAALQQSVSERLAALKARKAAAAAAAAASSTTTTTISSSQASAAAAPPPAKKAKVYELDLTETKPTHQLETEVPKKYNPYLAHVEPPPPTTTTTTAVKEGEGTTLPSTTDNKDDTNDNDDEEEEQLLDTRLAGGHTAKRRSRHKPLHFVEPGTFVAIAERKREKAALAAKSGFSSGRKEGTYVKSTGIVSVHDTSSGSHDDGAVNHQGGSSMEEEEDLTKPLPHRIDEDPNYQHCPYAMEWWDVELLPSKLKKQLASTEGNMIAKLARKQMQMDISSATSSIVQGQTPPEISNNITDDTIDNNDNNEPPNESKINRYYKAASLSNSKTSSLVQHPIPILPPGQTTQTPTSTSKPAVLHLTKKEMKRQRKLRRAEKQRELQDMQSAGLIPAPEPRLTLSNFMKVLGDQAVMDPSKMESVVMDQIQARKTKHETMNADRKLTKEQRSAKRARKLEENVSHGVLSVALFVVKDMSHRYHRTKVDLNAQQLNITGGVLECQYNPKLALVICEGGPKAIKRYIRLMTVRMKWKGEQFGDDDDDDEGSEVEEVEQDQMDMEGDGGVGDGEKEVNQKFNPNNKCELVWTGMGVKRMFHTFLFQSCATSEMARKVLEAKGVAHFWDQVLIHAKKSSSGNDFFPLKLGGGGNKDLKEEDDEDVNMVDS